MPRIKRWFPVSHDINRDPEMWDLEAKFGPKAIRIWLELLSIADRNDGEIPGEINAISTAVAWAVRTKTTKVVRCINAITTLGWLQVNGGLRVTKWLKYHRTEEQKPVPTRPNPTEPSEPPNPKSPDRTPSADLLEMQKQKDKEAAEDKRIVAVAQRIYLTDKVKYARLWEWLGKKKKGFPAAVILKTLTRFEPYSQDNEVNWWGYMEKIIEKERAKHNARSTESESANHKEEDRKLAAVMFSGSRLGQKTR